MPEALAAADHDFVLTGPASKLKQIRAKLFSSKRRSARRRTRRGRPYLKVLAAGLFVLLTCGILVNALVWQRTRHPAPLFARTVPSSPSKPMGNAELMGSAPRHARPAAIPAEPHERSSENAPAQRQAGDPLQSETHTPAEPRQTRASAPAAEPQDQISRLLQASHDPPAHGAAPASKPALPRESVLAAQRALVKLGFVLKPDGVPGPATLQALKRYERDHGLPVRGELTPALIRKLTAEAGRPSL